MEQKVYDVVVVGSGGAGLTAALQAKDSSADVLVVSKTYPTHSQTAQAQGGINCAINKEDIALHIEDTLKASRGLGSKEAISLMCEKGFETIAWLDSIGVPFSRTSQGEIKRRSLGGASNSRACFSSDYSGLKVLHSLYDTAIKKQVPFLNEHMLLNLIVEDEAVKGIVVLDIQTSQVKKILAKSVILATGGYGAIYDGHSTNSYASTGDGIAIAKKAGVRVSNLEFVQFHPTSMVGSSVLVSESARGEGGYLINSDGNRFVDELKPRDEVARAISTQILNGEKVYLDLRHLGLEKIMEAMPQERDLAIKFAGVKIEEELLQITPAAHYSMGGISTDINCQTNIKNLFAVGECANANIHGANRLGGNSLLEIVTFGKIAGVNASKAKEQEYDIPASTCFEDEKNRIDQIFEKTTDENFYDIKKQLAQVMFRDVGVFRDGKVLDEAKDFVAQLECQYIQSGIKDKNRIYNKTLVDYLQIENSLDLAKEIIASAIIRKQSCGAHFRSDDES